METIELKKNIHKIVDKIQNDNVLQSIYDFLKSKENLETGKNWISITKEQREEVLLAYEESEEANLISRSDLFKKS